ncbi:MULTISPECIES: hypothetical protein [Brenneria]|uniref:Lytic transglycosylase n=1 Tax=Brenneria nigrifluens DSM 30175 = ATCC 13028 TaxID=1121120 RepID=A0A2U1UU10_9GAMM|nr:MULTISPECIES: hypothetical protein [Brenneria]EHD21775.1 hypothetical protein BrE312_2395 [Brenneria sp. EniD312]PWC25128.1 hypothetical protein DDT54_04295 [Brenneria nigrifluens DSM 30175 = ATCC 13028]QCR04885.1 hypothetical protein EH206_12260 [Brenneria nigrifluens DSM 30175 = ATCC 13028]
MAQTIDELLVSLGLETDAKSFDQARAAFKGVTDNMLQMASALTAGFGFDKLTRQFAGFVSELDRFSKRNIIDPNNVLRWGYAFESMGGNVKDAMSAIEKINALRDDAREGRISKEALRNAGINPYELGDLQDSQSGLMWAATQMQKLSNNPDALTKFAKRLGFNVTEQDVLSKGPDWVMQQFEEYNKRGRVITPETIRIADEYNTAVQNLTTNLEGLGNSISERLTPKLTDLASRADKWLMDNKQGIVEKLDQAMPYLEQAAKGIAILVAINAAQKGGKMFLSNLPILGAAAYAEYFYNDFDNIKDSASSSWDYNKRQAGRWLNENINYPYSDFLGFFGLKDNLVPQRPVRMPTGPNPNANDIPGNAAPRGIRNNNPGNLNFMGQKGARKESGTNGRFAVFSSMDEGIEALYQQLGLYFGRGKDTIDEIIKTYAPASDGNNVAAYAEQLSRSIGKGRNERLNYNDKQMMVRLMQGIIDHENGKGYVQPQRIAGVVDSNFGLDYYDRTMGYYNDKQKFDQQFLSRNSSRETTVTVHSTVDARGASDPTAVKEAARQGAREGTREGLAEAGRNLKLSQESDIQ